MTDKPTRKLRMADPVEDAEPQANEDRQGRVVTFYSYKGGTGRTMALANTAWILAANGFRVLTVDWDLEAPGLAKFFRPFLDQGALAGTTGMMDLITDYREEALREVEHPPGWHQDFARVHPHALSLSWPGFPPGGSLDFLSAGQLNRDYSEVVGRLDWDLFYDRFDGGQFFDALKRDMSRRYDYILIDSRTGLSDIAEICTVQMPDDLVVCFTLSDQSIEGASKIAQHINDRYRERAIRILPVPMRIDEGEKEKADAGRALARLRFSGLPEGLVEEELAHYWGSVEIPYRPFYAYEEILATFGDQTGTPTSMLAACERLTSVLTKGRVTALPPLDEDVRLHWVEAYTRRRPTVPADLYLSFVPEDRIWADWIAAVLESAGFRVVPRDIGAGADTRQETERGIDAANRTVAVLSAAYLRAPQARALWDSMGGFDPSGSRRQIVPVRVSDVRLNAPFVSRNPVDLVGRDESQAAAILLRALGRADADIDAEVPIPRFPGTRPSYWSVPQRNPSFTGRAKVLEELREQLVGGPMVVLPTPQTLYGLGGVGKSQLALEYAHRYMSHYDLVWWIDAEQTDLIPTALSDLAARLGLRVGDSVNEAAEAAREALRRGNPTSRWLLIFDNADEPGEIRRFFPGGSGHILVTSRNQAWSGQAGVLGVDVFTRGESVEHLTRRTRGLSRADADRVAEAVGDLPLAVEVAAAWLDTTRTPVDTYVRQLQQEATRALAVGRPADYPTPVGATWNVSIARLREQSPAAVRLLQLCAFFAPEPISMDLFYSDQMIRSLVRYDEDLSDVFMLGKVIQAVGRYALAKVDAGSNSFQVHRLVQAVVRSEMDDNAREAAMHEVHRILVGARPALGDTDNPANWPRFEKIWPHLAPSRAQDCDERETRELLIDRVRYLWKRTDLDKARTLAEQLDATWTSRLGGEQDEGEARHLRRQVLSLNFQLANVVRSQGNFADARSLDERTLAGQKALLGEHNPYTLMTAGSLGADLRALGRFQEALDLDLETYGQFRELFGEENARTLSIANNLAIDYRLVGDSEAARDLDQDTYDRRAAVLGPRHPYTLSSKSNLARDLREIGDYKGSIELLREVTEELADVLQADLPENLRNAKSLAVSLRRDGHLREARQLTMQTYERYLDRFGAEAADTLACALNLAADHSASGDKEAARDLATTVYEGHQRLFGDEHPFTLACENNLGIYLRGSGDVDAAIRRGTHTVQNLRAVLGPDHPFTMNAMINLANAYGDGGLPAKAEELERAAYTGLCNRYGPAHPDAIACESNLAVTLRKSSPAQAAELREHALSELLRLFGEEHPNTVSARGWRRINRDLEPQPV
ncbi:MULTISPECIES: FxSxx-COOH system tetratricopeptide repeat protein [unclassified Kitasatospora]|uniref:FxSxx-COOH system tetratricopeptide repeat protein n=1 Tax=unclassified Kitasatospora TaxID=2633591 RepID=UPI0009E9D0B2|nr:MULTISPECIES: FxSxx-COOH system tetratricopeptide repeat protein [unclassified Kitasatospora]